MHSKMLFFLLNTKVVRPVHTKYARILFLQDGQIGIGGHTGFFGWPNIWKYLECQYLQLSPYRCVVTDTGPSLLKWDISFCIFAKFIEELRIDGTCVCRIPSTWNWFPELPLWWKYYFLVGVAFFCIHWEIKLQE